MTAPQKATLDRSADELAGSDEPCYELTLFVNGASDLSARAIVNARQLCDSQLDGRYRLAVVDVHENPDSALSARVLVTPTLIKYRPGPVRQIVGDLSHPANVRLALGLPVANDAARTLR
jgi:circadian clock protein KaiB